MSFGLPHCGLRAGTARHHEGSAGNPPSGWAFAIPHPAVGGRRYDPPTYVLGGTMRHTTTLLLTTLLLAGATAGCSSEPSYDDTVADCVQALKDRAEGSKDKPDACDGVKEDDYTALIMSQVLDDNGWTDENGEFDMGELLEDTTAAP